MILFSDNEIPNFERISDSRELRVQLGKYLHGLQDKLNYVLTHIGDGNINLQDISELAKRINSEGGGENASDS